MSDGVISKIQLPNSNIYDVVDSTSGYITGMTILSYGHSTWNDFLAAYNADKVVYCRASSNSNPASGSQTRLAFMAYVNNATTPTEVEFQYYRSVSTHTASQQGDQVYVYKLNKTNGWSVTTREASVKVVAGTGLGSTYSNGTITLTGPTKTSDLTNDSGFLTSYTETDPTVPSWAKASSKPSYDFSEIGSTPTTLSGYGITDASISSGVITLGSNTITPLTSNSTLNAAKLSGAIPSAVTATTQSASDNSTKIATTAYVTTAIANLPEPMLFKGSVGTGGTITSLPTAAAANEGFTYKVITALTTPVTAKVGDTVISNGSEWVVIPSGDEPSGTVTSVGLTNATNGGLTISNSPITSSGNITVGHSNVLTSAQTTQAVYPIKIDKNGHISEYGSAVTIPTKVSDLTNDSGFITSYTDENVTSTAVTSGAQYLVGSSSNTTTTDTLNKYADVFIGTGPDGRYLCIGNSSAPGSITLGGSHNTSIGQNSSLTSPVVLTLPASSGTLALTSDITIQSVSAGTGLNTSGSSSAVVLNLADSGVTAGTYDGGRDSKSGFYIPSFTVDSTGRITSATDLGTLIPFVTPNYSSIGVLSGTQYGPLFKCHSSASYDGNIPAGSTSATVSIGSSSGYVTQIFGVVAWEASTYKPVIVDWVSSSNNTSSSITVTVSIAETNATTIYFRLLITNSSSM